MINKLLAILLCLSFAGLLLAQSGEPKFAAAVNTNRLVRAEMLRQMWTKPKTRDGVEQSYAFGFLVGADAAERKIFNDGSQAGTRTYLLMLPEKNFAVALMTNLERAWCEELALPIADVVFDRTTRAAPNAEAPPTLNPNVNPGVYDAYVGQYQIAPI